MKEKIQQLNNQPSEIKLEDDVEAKGTFKNFLDKEKAFFGFVDREHEVYQKMREVLDQLIAVAGMNPEEIDFDIVLKNSVNAAVEPENRHILLNHGALFELSDERINLDEVVGYLAHELVHIKNFKKRTQVFENDEDVRVKNYILDREDERTSDLESLEIVNKAGYNPTSIINYFLGEAEREKAKQESDSDRPSVFHAMHQAAKLISDPHETMERRAEYLQDYSQRRLYKNRQKSTTELLIKNPIDQSNYGFIHQIKFGNFEAAINLIKEPWQVPYLLSMGQEEISDAQIETLKHDHFFPLLTDLSDLEKEVTWRILILDGGVSQEKINALVTEQDFDLTKVFSVIPKIVPSSELTFPPIDKSDGSEATTYSPVNKVASILYELEGNNLSRCLTQCLEDWQGKGEWTNDLLLNFIYKVRRQKLDGDLVSAGEKLGTFIEAINRVGIKFTQKEKITLYNIFKNPFDENISFSEENQDDVDQDEDEWNEKFLEQATKKNIYSRLLFKRSELFKFATKQCRDSADQKVSSDYLLEKERFLRWLNKKQVFEGSDVERLESLIPLVDNLEPRVALIVTELYNEDLEFDDKPFKFGWERESEVINSNKEQESYSSERYDEYGDEFDKDLSFEDLQLSEWVYLKTMIVKLFRCKRKTSLGEEEDENVQKTADFSQRKLEILLNSSASADQIARVFADITSCDTEDTSFQQLVENLLAIDSEKAKKIVNLLRLHTYSKIHEGEVKWRSDYKLKEEVALLEQASQAPQIPERNFLLLQIIESSPKERQAALFNQLRPLFYYRSKEEIRKDINQKIGTGEFFNKAIEGLLNGSLQDAVSIYGDEAEIAFDQAASLIWQTKRQEKDFLIQTMTKKIETINDFFPEVSVAREQALLNDINCQTNEERLKLLEELYLPTSRYQIGQEIYESQEGNCQSAVSVIGLIKQAFPEPSHFRDEKINQALLKRTVTLEAISQAEELLFQNNTMTLSDQDQLLHLFSLRVIPQAINVLPPELKIPIFTNLIEKTENAKKFQEYFPENERAELLKSFFSGDRGIDNRNYDFRSSIEGLFLKRVYSGETLERLKRFRNYEYKTHEYTEPYDKEIEEVGAGSKVRNRINFGEESTILQAEKIISKLSLAELEKFQNSYLLFTEYPELGVGDEQRAIEMILDKHYNRALKASLPKEIFSAMPTMQNVFFAIINTLGEQDQAEVLSEFIAFLSKNQQSDVNDLTVAFLEKLGPVYIKAGQHLASLGYFDRPLQMKLLKLTSSVEPISIFEVAHAIKEEYGDESEFIDELGPLLNTASIRQVHKIKLKESQEERIMKLKKPKAINFLLQSIDSLSMFVRATRQDQKLLQGVMLPEELITEIQGDIEKEIMRADDQATQNKFHHEYDGQKMAGKKLHIPVVDRRRSTSVVTIETIAPGKPLSEDFRNISPKTKKALLEFFLKLIFEKGEYHADPHPGNILESKNDLSLIDFGMVGKLSDINKLQFYKVLKSIYSGNQTEVLEKILEMHAVNGATLDKIDHEVCQQEFEILFEAQNTGENLEDLSLRLLNTLENVKISLDPEIKILIKTISQMGYLIEGQGEVIKEYLKKQIVASEIKKLLTGKSKVEKQIEQQVAEYLKKNKEQAQETNVVKFSQGTLIRSTRDINKNWELRQEVAIDRTKQTGDFLMFDFGNFKAGLIPGQHNYEVFRGGRWVGLEDLVLGKK